MEKIIKLISTKTGARLIGLIVAGSLYLIYKDDLGKYGGWIIISYYITVLLVIIPLAISQRDNPNSGIYYLINPNRLSIIPKIILILGILLCVAVWWYANSQTPENFKNYSFPTPTPISKW